MQPCVDGATSCADKLVVLHMLGEGVPSHQLW